MPDIVNSSVEVPVINVTVLTNALARVEIATSGIGNNGNDGSTGPTGPMGPTGPQGNTGPTGPQGPTGADSTVQGPTGPIGPTGATGSTGGTGPQGPTGSTGFPGDLYGTSSSTSIDLSSLTIGSNVFLTVASGLAYTIVQDVLVAHEITQYFHGPVVSYSGTGMTLSVSGISGSGTFADWQVNLNGAIGPAGAQGIQGIQGNTGPTGVAGATGNTGATGPQGNTGATGPTGATGTNGTDGNTGATGATGANGTNGNTGATGPTGPTGATGTAGATGTQGNTGATGSQGNTGTTGATGPTGATGATGSQGNTGATGASTLSGLTFTQTGAGAVGRSFDSKLKDTVSVKDFGALGDGANNDTTAIQAALDSGALNVYFPSGTYKVYTGLTLPTNVSIYGDGPAASIIDGSGATAGGMPVSAAHLRTAVSTKTALPALSVGVSQGTNYLQFVSAHGLSANDLIWISDPNTNWSKYISYDRTGEIKRIATPYPGATYFAGSTVATLQGYLFDNYTPSGVSLWKITGTSTCSIRDIWIKACGLSGSYDYGMRLNSLVDSTISNVKVTNASNTGIALRFGFNVAINNCTSMEDAHNMYGLDYGLTIMSCQDVIVEGGYYTAARHGMAMGADTITNGPAVINRNVAVLGATIKSDGKDMSGVLLGVPVSPPYLSGIAADVHSPAEYITYRDCFLDGGLQFAGDHITIDGNTIIGDAAGGGLITFSGMVGGNVTIKNNRVVASSVATANVGTFINMGAQTDTCGVSTSRGGMVVINNNNFEYSFTNTAKRTQAGNTANTNTITLFNTGYTGENISLDIKNNTFNASADYPQGSVLISSSGTTGGYKKFDTINFSNNTCNNVGGLIVYPSVTAPMAENLIVQANTVINAYDTGFYLKGMKNSVVFKQNTINGTRAHVTSGTGLSGTVYSAVSVVSLGGTGISWDGKYDLYASDNIVTNGCSTVNYAGSVRADYFFSGFNKAISNNNIYGTDTKSLVFSAPKALILNEIVTGMSTGASARITGFVGLTQIGIGPYLSLSPSGTGISSTEVLSFSSSAGTATNTATTTNKAYGILYFQGNSCWYGMNTSVSVSGLTQTFSGVTNSYPLNSTSTGTPGTSGAGIISNLVPHGICVGDLIGYGGSEWSPVNRDFLTSPSLWQTLTGTAASTGFYPSSVRIPMVGNDSLSIDGSSAALGELMQIRLYGDGATDPSTGITLNAGTWFITYTIYDGQFFNPVCGYKDAYTGITLINAPLFFQPHKIFANGGAVEVDAHGYAYKIRGNTANGYDGRNGPYGLGTGCTQNPNIRPINPADPCHGEGVQTWHLCTQNLGYTYNGVYYDNPCNGPTP